MNDDKTEEPCTFRCPRCQKIVSAPGYCHACYLNVKDERREELGIEGEFED